MRLRHSQSQFPAPDRLDFAVDVATAQLLKLAKLALAKVRLSPKCHRGYSTLVATTEEPFDSQFSHFR